MGKQEKLTAKNKSELARLLNVTPKTIIDWEVKRGLDLGEPPFDVEEIRQWRVDNLPRSKGRPPLDGGQRVSDAARLLKANADRRELEVIEKRLDIKERQGLIIDREESDQRLSEVILIVRNSFLELPAKLAPIVAKETDPTDVETILEEEVETILNRVADTINFESEEEDEENEED